MSRKYYDDNYILINEKGVLYKISKITPHADGGFNILMPYCSEKKGIVIQMDIPMVRGEFSIPHDQISREYTIDAETKLSIHQSGFVQFSGKGVLSGLDEHGKIKGIGVNSSPLKNPIKSGPTFGFTLWGIQHYELKEGAKKSVNEIIFGEDDFYYRYNCRLIEKHENIDLESYLIEGFYFSNNLLPHVNYVNGHPQITLQFNNIFEIPNAIFTFKVIFIENSPGFIGLIASKTSTVHKEAKTGYILNGPGGNIRDNIATTIFCCYPIPPGFDKPEYSLEYQPILRKEKITMGIFNKIKKIFSSGYN